MARVVITASADADFMAIITDLAEKAGVHVAEVYVSSFDTRYRRLSMFPNSGAKRPKLGSQARICMLLPFVVIYDYLAADDIVIVIRILHGRRRITRTSIRDQ